MHFSMHLIFSKNAHTLTYFIFAINTRSDCAQNSDANDSQGAQHHHHNMRLLHFTK